MIHFPPLRTKRLDVQLRELTIRQAVDLAATPLNGHEAAVTALLACIVQEARGQHSRPGRWTVQERMMVVAHYIACTSEGEGNFAIGDGRLLDYLDDQTDAAPDTAAAGEACGDVWTAHQLTGDEASIMEGLCRTRLDWMSADMAARMRVVGEADQRPDSTDRPGEFAGWLAERMSVMQAMPESDFEDLFRAYRVGLGALHHLFRLELDDHGFVAMPRKEGGSTTAPARFQVAAAFSALAIELGQQPQRSSGDDGPERWDSIPDGADAAAELHASVP